MAARTRSDEHGDRHAAEEAVAEAAKRTDTAQPQLTVTAANGFAVRALIDASADSDLLVAGTRGGGVVPAPEPWLHREPGSAPCTVPGCHSAARKLTDELRMEWRVRAARVGSADLNDEGPTGINRRAPTAPRSRVPSRLAHTWLCPHERIAVRGAASPSAASDSCAPTIAISGVARRKATSVAIIATASTRSIRQRSGLRSQPTLRATSCREYLTADAPPIRVPSRNRYR